MRVLNVYKKNTPNIGDLASSPALYFPELGATQRDADDKAQECDLLILGGGGMFCLDHLQRHVHFARAGVAWGIGLNDHVSHQSVEYPEWLAKLYLVGLRDFNSRNQASASWTPWTPCASCMSPEFDVLRKPSKKYVQYDHGEEAFAAGMLDTSIPYLTNTEPKTLKEALDFLGDGEVILTTSYHGAYWGTLLGRRVVILRPFSSKFFHLRHQPEICMEPSTWRHYATRAKSFPNALGECRAANQFFYQQVTKLARIFKHP